MGGLNGEIDDRCFIHEFDNEIYRYQFVNVALQNNMYTCIQYFII